MAMPKMTKLVKSAGKQSFRMAEGKAAKNLDKIANATAKLGADITIAKNPIAGGFRDTIGRNLTNKGTIKGGQAFKDVAWNMGHALSKDGGGIWANYGKQAAIGAGIGAVGNGTLEWGQGGSFWEGAKSGAVNGALWGAGVGAFKAGMGVPGGKGGTIRQAGSRFSKQVTTMFRAGNANEQAMKNVIKKK